jgi:hypothetical protein
MKVTSDAESSGRASAVVLGPKSKKKMTKLSVNQVFTPNDVPTCTYVNRSALRLEEKLQSSLAISKMIVSVSGPSKAGKSVLIQKIIPREKLVSVSGATIKAPSDVWDQALQWMGSPSMVSKTVGHTLGVGADVKLAAEGGIPLLAKSKAEGQASGHADRHSSKTEEYRSAGLQDVVRIIGGSDYILFIDDFHYIPRKIQTDVGRQLKAITERGVKVCAASVPHRADDVVRSNPELSGRVCSVKIDYWEHSDLRKIGEQGFQALNVSLEPLIYDRLAREAFGSPQLMQALCLNLCLALGIDGKQRRKQTIDATAEHISRALEDTAGWADYSSVVQGLHSGPKERGTERKHFCLRDDTRGDVYRVILSAISQDPPSLSFTYDQLLSRVSDVCIDDKPVGSSITQALGQMEALSKNLSKTVPIIEWNENVLDIVEPYFLFYLRASKKLEKLSKQ